MGWGWLGYRWMVALAAALALAAAGCGSSSSGPRTVALALLAPTDGSTVNVRSLDVVGKVDPPTATVVVAGRRVAVVRGAFKRPLLLSGKSRRISISAHAPGYQAAHVVATVHYKPGPRGLGGGGGSGSGVTSSRSIGGGGGGSASRGATSSSGGVGGGGSGDVQVGTVNPGPGLGDLTTAAGRASFMSICTGNHGTPAFCACFYQKVVSSPQLRNNTKVYALVSQLVSAAVSNDPAAIPPLIRNSALACAPKLITPSGAGP